MPQTTTSRKRLTFRLLVGVLNANANEYIVETHLKENFCLK